MQDLLELEKQGSEKSVFIDGYIRMPFYFEFNTTIYSCDGGLGLTRVRVNPLLDSFPTTPEQDMQDLLALEKQGSEAGVLVPLTLIRTPFISSINLFQSLTGCWPPSRRLSSKTCTTLTPWKTRGAKKKVMIYIFIYDAQALSFTSVDFLSKPATGCLVPDDAGARHKRPRNLRRTGQPRRCLYICDAQGPVLDHTGARNTEPCRNRAAKKGFVYMRCARPRS